jgi:hypothetical protein
VALKPGTLFETLEGDLGIVVNCYDHGDYLMYIVLMSNELRWPGTYYAFYEHEIRSLEDE